MLFFNSVNISCHLMFSYMRSFLNFNVIFRNLPTRHPPLSEFQTLAWRKLPTKHFPSNIWVQTCYVLTDFFVLQKNRKSPRWWGEMIQFDLRIVFKWVGKNHQLVSGWRSSLQEGLGPKGFRRLQRVAKAAIWFRPSTGDLKNGEPREEPWETSHGTGGFERNGLFVFFFARKWKVIREGGEGEGSCHLLKRVWP